MAVWVDGKPLPRREPNVVEVIAHLAKVNQTTEEMARNAVLSALSLACQQIIVCQRPNESVTPVSLILITVADSGESKTRIEKEVLKPFRNFEQASEESDRDKFKKYEILFESFRAKKRGIERAITKSAEKSESTEALEEKFAELLKGEPQRPRSTKFLYDDATTAALFKGLEESWPSAGIFDSDAATILTGKTFEDLPLFNKWWDGDIVRRDRASLVSSRQIGVRLTLGLGVQREPFARFLKRNDGMARSSGFLARALIAVPQVMAGRRNVAYQPSPHSDILELFLKRVQKLLEKSKARIEDDKFDGISVKLSDYSKDAWTDFAQKVENGSGPDGQYQSIKDHASKMPDNVLRIAALIAFFEKDEMVVGASSMDTAIKYGWQYLDSAKGLDNGGVNLVDYNDSVSTILNWMREQSRFSGESIFQVRRIINYGPNRLRNSALVRKILSDLESRGRVVFLRVDGKECVRLMPSLYDL